RRTTACPSLSRPAGRRGRATRRRRSPRSPDTSSRPSAPILPPGGETIIAVPMITGSSTPASFQAGDRTLSALVDEAEHPIAWVVLAHGAGNDMRAPFLAGAAEGLTAGGVSCMRFNFPFTESGRRAPDRPPVL